MMNDGTKIYDHNKYVQSNKLLLTFFPLLVVAVNNILLLIMPKLKSHQKI